MDCIVDGDTFWMAGENAGPIELRSGGRDRDALGRQLRTVWRNGRSVGDILVFEGLAHGRTGYQQSWCG